MHLKSSLLIKYTYLKLAIILFLTTLPPTILGGDGGVVKRLEELELAVKEQKERFQAGKTFPGEGFEKYPLAPSTKNQSGWVIKIPYPENIKNKIQEDDEVPIITISLGGRSNHWTILGTSSVYTTGGAFKHPDGFTVYLRPNGNIPAPESKVWNYPEEQKWYVNYVIFFEEKSQ